MKLVPVKVKLNEDAQIFIQYSDRTEGTIDLSDMLGKYDIDRIDDIGIDEKTRDIIVNKQVRLCKNAVYRIVKIKSDMNRIGLRID